MFWLKCSMILVSGQCMPSDHWIPITRLAGLTVSACLHARCTKTMPTALALSCSVLLLLLSVSIQTQDIMYLHARTWMIRT